MAIPLIQDLEYPVIIADAGSTSVKWALIDKNKQTYQTEHESVNPNYVSRKKIISNFNAIRDWALQHVDEVKSVYFFGAGVTADTEAYTLDLVKEGLFDCPHLICSSDIDIAAWSVLENNTGVASIIGTGSNSAFYSNGEKVHQIPTLGFVLGDEGSAGHIGKLLIQSYFYEVMPEAMRAEFYETYQLTKAELLNVIKGGGSFNKYFASYAAFVEEHREDAFIQNTLRKAFRDFVEYHIEIYEQKTGISKFDLQLGFVGSVAYYNATVLKDVLTERGFDQNKVSIEKSPLEGLLKRIVA